MQVRGFLLLISVPFISFASFQVANADSNPPAGAVNAQSAIQQHPPAQGGNIQPLPVSSSLPVGSGFDPLSIAGPGEDLAQAQNTLSIEANVVEGLQAASPTGCDGCESVPGVSTMDPATLSKNSGI